MRGMSKAAKAEAYDALRKDRDAAQEIATALLTGEEPDATAHICEDVDGEYEFRLYRCLRAHAGIVVEIYRHCDQKASISIRHCDDFLATINRLPYQGFFTDLKIAADTLRRARAEIYQRSTTALTGG